ncbi:hypothetical protein MNBD_PLANCTO02-2912 [hydrothermal vent metagenome]|uniref:Phage protein n=1 Tax=hydrothermal vent metagenome TaxID=652676 RepID=A0A3B1DP90_9ZZZZ
MTTLNHQSISAGLQTWWRDQFPLSVATAYPGLFINTETMSEWIEIQIDTWSRRPQRAIDKRLLDFSLTIHCFVKPTGDTKRIHVLTDAVRETLAQRDIPIKNYDVSAETVIGFAKLFEIEVRDLSRNDFDSNKHRMFHSALSCTGFAQEI